MGANARAQTRARDGGSLRPPRSARRAPGRALLLGALALAGGLLATTAAASGAVRPHGTRGAGRAASATHRQAPRHARARHHAAAHQPRGTKWNCIYLGNASRSDLRARITAAEQVTHVPYQCFEIYATNDATWADWVSPWATHRRYGWSSWLRAAPTKHHLVLTIQMIPFSVSKNSKNPPHWEVPCAAGAYDHYAAALGRKLVASGFGHAVVRLGSEASGTWEPDFVGTTAKEAKNWATCWAREVGAIRKAKGAHFRFDLTYDDCYDYLPFSSYYPGNKAVDIIGLDFYDQSCDRKLPTASRRRWLEIVRDKNSLNAVAAFAAAHHKPVSFPEWGLLKSGGGDDPYFVAGIGRFMKYHDTAYQAYFDTPANANVLQMNSEVPRALAAYRRWFAPRPRSRSPSSPTTTTSPPTSSTVASTTTTSPPTSSTVASTTTTSSPGPSGSSPPPSTAPTTSTPQSSP